MDNSTREDEILKLLEETPKHYLSVAELADHFAISPSTIRRDLVRLDALHKVAKTHGGAALFNYLGEFRFEKTDRNYREREQTEQVDKKIIATYAASLVKQGSCVYLDASTTVGYLVPYLPVAKNILYVTNSPDLAARLTDTGHIVLVTGGSLKTATSAFVGEYALSFLEHFNFDLGFFGCNGIHPTAGFSTPDPVEAEIKRKAMSRTYQSYVLADHTKFDLISSVTFAGFSGVTLITDSVPEKYRPLLKFVDLSTKTRD